MYNATCKCTTHLNHGRYIIFYKPPRCIDTCIKYKTMIITMCVRRILPRLDSDLDVTPDRRSKTVKNRLRVISWHNIWGRWLSWTLWNIICFQCVHFATLAISWCTRLMTTIYIYIIIRYVLIGGMGCCNFRW